MSESKSSGWGRIVVFLGLTFGLSAIFWAIIARAGSVSAGGGAYTLGLMWCPGVAALLTTLLFQRNLRGLGWGLGKRRFLLPAYFLPIGYGLVAYGLVWLTGLGAFTTDGLPEGTGLAGFLAVSATIMVAVSLLSATGEEIGWRGLLVPELAERLSFNQTALLSGCIWAAWHLPVIVLADYNSAAPRAFAIACFVVEVLGISFALAWLRLGSGSLWPAALLHGTHNLWVQSVFDRLMKDTGPTVYLTGEFGIVLAVAIVVAAGLCVRYGRRSMSARASAAG